MEEKIAALEKAIATEEEEMKNAGMTLTDRITALKPDKERLAALEMQKAIAMRGTPALCLAHNVCLVSDRPCSFDVIFDQE